MRFGRDAECARIDGLLADAREGRSSVLVVSGEAGIGKTDLLRYAEETAMGMVVLMTHAVESEAEIPFGGLSELMNPLLGRLDRLPQPQAAALAGALALGPPAARDRFAVAAATLSLLAASAEEQPLLALVDDAHWLDAPTAEALLFAARRLNSDSVALLFAVRAGEHAALELSRLPTLELSGLDTTATQGLLAGRDRTVPEAVAERLLVATQGNPLALIELSELLSEAQLAGREPLPDPLPVGSGIEHAYLARVSGLPADTRGSLLVAAAGESAKMDAIVCAVQALGLEPSSFEPAEAAGLLAIAGGRLEWRHPLVRSAVYHGALPAERRAAHRALADTLGRDSDADRRAWHLAAAATVPDEHVAAALEQAAVNAGGHGGVVAAAAALERAAGLTPSDQTRARRLLDAARYSVLAGRLAGAAELVEQALPVAVDPVMRADIQHLRARIALWEGEPLDAYRLLVTEAARVEDIAPGTAVALLADAARAASLSGDIPAELGTARRADAVAARGGPEERLVATAALGRALVLSGDRETARPLLASCTAMLEGCDPLALAFVAQLVSEGSVWIEEYGQARRVLERVIDAARAASAIGLLPQALANLSELDFRVGRFAPAYARASESLTIADALGQAGEATFSLVCLAQVEAAQGREVDCRAHAAEAIARATKAGSDTGFVYGRYALGLLELGLGRPEDAIVHLEVIARIVAELGLEDPGVLQWAADLIEAYALAGRSADAELALVRLERQAERTGSAWALAVGARCRGFLADDSGLERDFEAALTRHERTPSPFERARTMLRYGERLRRSRRLTEARALLHAAIETFERLSAEPWAARARVELAAAGERERLSPSVGLAALTPQELQISLLVAQGATNREAATALFLSTKTIEFHLGKVFRKLGLRSRTELTRLVAQDGAASAPAALEPAGGARAGVEASWGDRAHPDAADSAALR